MEGGRGVDSTVGDTGGRLRLKGAIFGRKSGVASTISGVGVVVPITDRP